MDPSRFHDGVITPVRSMPNCTGSGQLAPGVPHTRTTGQRARCPSCERNVPVRKDGCYAIHKAQ